MKFQGLTKESLMKRQNIYKKINFWTGLIAVLVVIANLVFTIISEFVVLKIRLDFAVSITLLSIGLLDLVPLIISWVALRKIKKQLVIIEKDFETDRQI